jgi:hypothetical protein
MARPRVFVSSTYYDLKHLRSSIENFIDGLGYEPVLSEKDNIAFIPDVPLDDSCYREVRTSDIYVLIIGGRYGSEISSARSNTAKSKSFFERYESITKHEYLSALERNIPTYVLVDAAVDAEYQTFLKNESNTAINYAHVDSVNVFVLIKEIRQRGQNNPIKLFSRYAEIEAWLREQWAGFFRELILRMSTTQQIQHIDKKIEELSETTETLKRYLEEVVASVAKQKTDATDIIAQENQRLKQAKQEAEFLGNGYLRHLNRNHGKSAEQIRDALQKSANYEQFVKKMFPDKKEACASSIRAFVEISDARSFLQLPKFDRKEFEEFRDSYRPSKLPDQPLANGRKNPKVPMRKKSLSTPSI